MVRIKKRKKQAKNIVDLEKMQKELGLNEKEFKETFVQLAEKGFLKLIPPKGGLVGFRLAQTEEEVIQFRKENKDSIRSIIQYLVVAARTYKSPDPH